MSPVGLLPAALQGIDTAALLRGAAGMDDRTRRRDPWQNPAMMLALAWYWLGGGRGDKHMVVLPYRDRLDLFPRYVQQLVMESVGKRADRSGKVVRQGLTVYGHKGVTDQHAYVQQLREGRDDAFVTFIAVDTDRDEPSPRAGPSLGDHLFANLEGLRDALTEQGRASVTISLTDAGPASLGALIALHERAVGLYAELADLNAYHQPGVDKDIAAPALSLRHAALEYLRQEGGPATAQEIAAAIGQPDRVETVYRALRREALRATGPVRMETVAQPFGERFSWRPEGPAAQPERRSAATGAPAGR
jgi:glucose-6-phosphate isomerase